MAEYITLLGAEDVRRAANEMTGAASAMRSAASEFDSAVRQQQMMLDNFMGQFNDALDRLAIILETQGRGQ